MGRLWAFVRGIITRLFSRSRLFGKQVFLGRGVLLDLTTRFEGKNKVYSKTNIKGAVVGRGTYIGGHCDYQGAKIGRFCSIAPESKIVLGRHPATGFVSTHPAFFSARKQAGFTFVSTERFEENRRTHRGYTAEVGNDVWIGQGARILEGVSVGDGAIVGANALVTKDVEPFSIVGGCPARVIGWRFEEAERRQLAQVGWWNWTDEKLELAAEQFSSIERFLKQNPS